MKAFWSRVLSVVFFTFTLGYLAAAADPIVHISAPTDGTSTTGPVKYIASASSPGCAQGILAMRIYSAPHVEAYTVDGGKINTYINLRNGYLSPVPGTPFAAHRSVSSVAVHPSGKLVFAALSEYAAGDGVAVFQVQPDGSLKLASGSPYSTQTGPQAFTQDPAGNYLYVADGNGYIDAFHVDTVSAALTPLPGSPFQLSQAECEPAYPVDLFNFAGNDLYAADGTSGVIEGYAISPSVGTLTALPSSPWLDTHCEGGGGIDYPEAWMSPRSLAVDGSGKFLYALNNWEDNIAIYSITSDGTLKFRKFAAQDIACYGAVRTDPTGNYLYAGSCVMPAPLNNYNALVGFSINHTTGDLTPLPTSPYTYPQPGRPLVQDIAITP